VQPNEYTTLELAYTAILGSESPTKLQALAQSLVEISESSKQKLDSKLIRGYLQRFAANNDVKGALAYLNFARQAGLTTDEQSYAIVFRIYEQQRDLKQMESIVRFLGILFSF